MTEHDERADRLEGEANLLEAEGEQVDDRIQDAKQDIESKVSDTGVPGAQPTAEELETEVAEHEQETAAEAESSGDEENEVGGV
jgi:hypothetical protein